LRVVYATSALVAGALIRRQRMRRRAGMLLAPSVTRCPTTGSAGVCESLIVAVIVIGSPELKVRAAFGVVDNNVGLHADVFQTCHLVVPVFALEISPVTFIFSVNSNGRKRR